MPEKQHWRPFDLNFHPLVAADATCDSGDSVWLDTSGQWEFNSGSVADSDNVSGSWSLKKDKERSLKTVLSVDFHDLLVVVRTLKKLNSGIQRTSISGHHNLDRLDSSVKGVSLDGSSLHDLSGGHVGQVSDDLLKSGSISLVSLNNSREGVLKRTSVVDGNSVRSRSGSLNDSAESAEFSVLKVDSHLLRSVIGSLPQFNVSVKRTSISLHQDLDTLNIRRARPGAEGSSSLDNGGRGRVPDVLDRTGLGSRAAGGSGGVSSQRDRRGSGGGGGRAQTGLGKVGADLTASGPQSSKVGLAVVGHVGREQRSVLKSSTLLVDGEGSGTRDGQKSKEIHVELHGGCRIRISSLNMSVIASYVKV